MKPFQCALLTTFALSQISTGRDITNLLTEKAEVHAIPEMSYPEFNQW